MPERVEGFVRVHIQNKRYFFIDADGQEYFAHEDNIVAPSGHICTLEPGTKVTFTIQTKPGRQAGRAADVRLLEPPEMLERETSVITAWLGSHGFGSRDCRLGCEIFIHRRDVLSDLSKRPEGNSLRAGDRIQHGTVESVFKPGKFQAVEIDVVKPQEEA